MASPANTTWYALGPFSAPTPSTMRQIEGWLSAVSTVADDLAPFIEARVSSLGKRERIDFMIDSGSDTTILMPTDALHLMGERFFDLDFRSGPEAVLLTGIGAQAFRILPIDSTLTLEDDADSPVDIQAQLWVAEPQPVEPSEQGNWLEPSIFGRDAIRPGDFELSYIKGTAILIRPDDE